MNPYPFTRTFWIDLTVACVLLTNRGRTLSRSQVGLKQKCLFPFSRKCEISAVLAKFPFARISSEHLQWLGNFAKITFFPFLQNFHENNLVFKKTQNIIKLPSAFAPVSYFRQNFHGSKYCRENLPISHHQSTFTKKVPLCYTLLTSYVFFVI